MTDSNSIFVKKPAEGQPWDVVIVGSGPSGLTSAIYTTRGAASTLIIGGDKWGGQLMLTTEVDNFPAHKGIQGPELMTKMREHAIAFGGEFLEKNVSAVDFSSPNRVFKLTADNTEYLAKSVIVAVGSETRWLGIPGEEKLRGRGVSSCAPCDAPFFKKKNVAVIGGGDSAMEEALVLTKYATKVTIIYRKEVFRASKAMQKRVEAMQSKGKIEVVWNSEVKEFKGEGKLETLSVFNNKTNETVDTAFDGAFVAIGHVPSTSIFKGHLELDQKGYVLRHVKNGYQSATSVPGVFVAGDVHDYHYKQAITAAGFGCQAGMEALRFLDTSS